MRTYKYFFLFAACTFVQFTIFFLPFTIAENKLLGSTKYGFPLNLFGDYYHYTYFLKSGSEGKLYFKNVYTDIQDQPLQILEPHYNLFGLFLKPFQFTPHQLFYLFRLFAMVFLNGTIFILCIKIFNKQKVWILTVLFLFLVANPFWILINGIATEYEVWSNMFNNIRRLITLPPHYLIGTGLIVFLLMNISRTKTKAYSYFITIFLASNLAFMHPYIAIYVCVYIFIDFLIESIIKKKLSIPHLIHLVSLIVSILPVISLYYYFLTTMWQSPTLTAGTLTVLEQPFPFLRYMASLGPLFVLAFPTLIRIHTWKTPLLRVLAIWTITPLILFFLPYIGIPMSPFRLFQTYQYVPLAVLATYTLFTFLKRISSIRKYIFLLSILFIVGLYSLPPAVININSFVDSSSSYFKWYKIIEESRDILSYLNTQTPQESVVIAPDPVSSFIPSFTHNRVIIGQEGCNPNHNKNKMMTDSFYGGLLTADQAKVWLTNMKADYILFGLETLPLSKDFLNRYPFIEPIYISNSITITKVTL